MINIEIINEIDDTQMIRSFGESIYTGKIKTNEAEMDQSNLL